MIRIDTKKKLSYPLLVTEEDLRTFEEEISLPGIGEALRRARLVKIREDFHV
jgi:hypothetical protein